MPFRHTETQYSEDDFTNKSTLARNYTGPTATTFSIDGTVLGDQTDLGGPTGLRATIKEFEDDVGPRDVSKRTAGGILVTRSSVAPDTLTIAPRPAVPFARAVALRELLDALGYGPAVP